MKAAQLQELILELLEPGVYKTTAQVVAEFRAEYPASWRELEKEGETLYGGGCGTIQQPPTRISQVLLSLPEECCLRLREGSGYRWSKAT